MYKVLSKDMLKVEIIPYLFLPKRGFVSKALLIKIVNCILYKLKTEGIMTFITDVKPF